MVLVSGPEHPGLETRDPIFEPPEEAIVKILPFLVYRRELRILGHPVHANNLFYDVEDGRIVKTGVSASVYEAKVMIFVRNHTSIPVPARRRYPYTARLDGTGERTPASPDSLVTSDQFHDAPPSRPFHSVDEFHAYFLDRLRPLWEAKDTYDLLEQVRSKGEESEPVLTHGDLAPRNILVKDGRIVTVVDWETFGWYPDFWEYMGIGDEVMPRVTFRAIEATFGKTALVYETYRYVQACLTQHDLLYR
ncbi:hypothetical protein K466DRAFT_613316 [Polyporus arcularius HHB13444]|uniref:Aminoglycoside phosphotransferase domain-containing protein n=1 Tax=Polyporus arcularius HHB13444 TaxID=1314778 RepID=A0A5C3PJL3_9APHY|nr:hypothetical protein K466DRAFT_613316 [Polyporus arcularius HHB13444]